MTLETLAIIIAVVVSVGGAIVATYKVVRKVDETTDRPYPCQKLLDLEVKTENDLKEYKLSVEKKFEEHDGYLSKDKKEIEELKLKQATMDEMLRNTGKSIERIERNVDKILDIMIMTRDEK